MLETDFDTLRRRLGSIEGSIDEEYVEDRLVGIEDLENASETWRKVRTNSLRVYLKKKRCSRQLQSAYSANMTITRIAGLRSCETISGTRHDLRHQRAS